MARGRPPKPTKLKILTGNPGKRPLPKREPQPKPGAPGCPEWLDAAAKAEWRRIVPELKALGLLTQVDRAALASYCVAWSELKHATDTLAREGRTVRTGGAPLDAEDPGGPWAGGQLQPHPAIGMQRSAWTAIKAFATEFGFTPSSRSRVQTPAQPEAADPFEEFLRRGKTGKN